MPFISNTATIVAGAAAVAVYTCPADLVVTLSSINVYAPTSPGQLTVSIFRQSTGQTVNLLAGLNVAVNDPYTHPKPIMLSAGDSLMVAATGADLSIDIGGAVGEATAGSAVLVARGAYDAQATYQKLHIVEEAGSSYLCLVDGLTGVAPPSASWMTLAEKGDEGQVAGHTHAIGDVTGLQTALDGKAASSHSHGISDVTGLQTALNGKATSAQGAKADAAMPKAGGDFTGPVKTLEVRETVVVLTGPTPTVNVAAGTSFALTTSANTTFTFAAPPAGSGLRFGFEVEVTSGGQHTHTWPATVGWPDGQAPDAPASGETDVYVFRTRDGGASWHGAQAMDNV